MEIKEKQFHFLKQSLVPAVHLSKTWKNKGCVYITINRVNRAEERWTSDQHGAVMRAIVFTQIKPWEMILQQYFCKTFGTKDNVTPIRKLWFSQTHTWMSGLKKMTWNIIENHLDFKLIWLDNCTFSQCCLHVNRLLFRPGFHSWLVVSAQTQLIMDTF